MNSSERLLRICSLFAGCGGLDLGFERAEHERLKYYVKNSQLVIEQKKTGNKS
jgi:hypothetical protein